MNLFVKFMGSTAGRAIRVFAGTGLIAYGLMGVGGSNGYILAGIGVLPILTGLFNICIIGPLLGEPLSGAKARAAHS